MPSESGRTATLTDTGGGVQGLKAGEALRWQAHNRASKDHVCPVTSLLSAGPSFPFSDTFTMKVGT